MPMFGLPLVLASSATSSVTGSSTPRKVCGRVSVLWSMTSGLAAPAAGALVAAAAGALVAAAGAAAGLVGSAAAGFGASVGFAAAAGAVVGAAVGGADEQAARIGPMAAMPRPRPDHFRKRRR